MGRQSYMALLSIDIGKGIVALSTPLFAYYTLKTKAVAINKTCFSWERDYSKVKAISSGK